jgi:hypothetical protein
MKGRDHMFSGLMTATLYFAEAGQVCAKCSVGDIDDVYMFPYFHWQLPFCTIELFFLRLVIHFSLSWHLLQCYDKHDRFKSPTQSNESDYGIIETPPPN